MRRYKINMWAIDKYVSSKERYFNPGYTIGREYTMGISVQDTAANTKWSHYVSKIRLLYSAALPEPAEF